MDASTRDRLLEAAGQEFAARGYEKATVRDICVRAGANVSAVNYHFGDKQKLYEEVILQAHCKVKGVSYDGEPGRPAPERLRAFVASLLSEMVRPEEELSWQRRLVLREMLDPSSALDRVVAESIRPRYHALRQIFRELCPDADDCRLTALAMSVVGQCLQYKIAGPVMSRLMPPEIRKRLTIEYLTDHIALLVLSALGHGPAGWPRDEGGGGSCAGSR